MHATVKPVRKFDILVAFFLLFALTATYVITTLTGEVISLSSAREVATFIAELPLYAIVNFLLYY